MNTVIIDGHPNSHSLCAAIAAHYAEAHGDASVVALRDLQFDPSLHLGYTRRQELEPDLERAWQLLLDAQHAGRTGRVIVTSDSPWWYLRLVGDTTVRHVRDTTLRFCGIKPVRATRLGPVKGSTVERRERWLAHVARLGRADAARLSARDSRQQGSRSATEERVGTS